MQLEFFGAAGEVTGSCHILRVAGRQLLLDCGMIQGDHDAPARNRLPFPFDPTTIDVVVLSHAHIDHCGRLPLLVKRGFRGPIYTNKACADLVPILLRDSANLAMRDAERERVSPLYDLEDVETTLRLLQPIAYDTRRELLPGVTVQVRDAGHILGSSSIEVWVSEGGEQRKLVFSGDLGQYDTPILKDPFAFESADLVLMESTYGNRQHRGREDTERELGGILAQAQRDGGNVIVPAFAIGRSQELLYLLAKHYGEWHLARWKIFLDSPMAIAASRVYWNNPDRFDEETTSLRESFRGMPPLPNLVLSESADDSRAINHVRSGALIIAGSGMATGGRVLRHLAATISNPKHTVMFVGYQAAGTRGRLLVDGAREIKLLGRIYPVAARVERLDSMSAHADYRETMRWLSGFTRPPGMTHLVHGDPAALAALAARITAEKQWPVHIAAHHERVEVG